VVETAEKSISLPYIYMNADFPGTDTSIKIRISLKELKIFLNDYRVSPIIKNVDI
jgi:hypothetical protein